MRIVYCLLYKVLFCVCTAAQYLSNQEIATVYSVPPHLLRLRHQSSCLHRGGRCCCCECTVATAGQRLGLQGWS